MKKFIYIGLPGFNVPTHKELVSLSCPGCQLSRVCTALAWLGCQCVASCQLGSATVLYRNNCIACHKDLLWCNLDILITFTAMMASFMTYKCCIKVRIADFSGTNHFLVPPVKSTTVCSWAFMSVNPILITSPRLSRCQLSQTDETLSLQTRVHWLLTFYTYSRPPAVAVSLRPLWTPVIDRLIDVVVTWQFIAQSQLLIQL